MRLDLRLRSVAPAFGPLLAVSLSLLGSACVGRSDSAYLDPPTGAVQNTNLVQITPQGVGALSAGTSYSSKAISAAMPGFQVQPITMATEDSTPSALALFQDGRQVLQIVENPDGTIGAIHGVTQYMTGPNGERIGMSLAEAGVDPSLCRPGEGNWRGMPICRARGARNVELVFSIPGYEVSNALPPPQVMAQATLQRIVWLADGAAQAAPATMPQMPAQQMPAPQIQGAPYAGQLSQQSGPMELDNNLIR